MVLATSHIISALGISYLISKRFEVSKLGFSLAALGALVPDFDFLLVIIFGDMGLHRMFLNFLWIPFVLFGFGYLLFSNKRLEVAMFCFAGYLSHVLLDYIQLELITLAMIDGALLTIIVASFVGYYIFIGEKRSEHA